MQCQRKAKLLNEEGCRWIMPQHPTGGNESRRWVALPYGFVSQAGDNLRSSLFDMQFAQRATSQPGEE